MTAVLDTRPVYALEIRTVDAGSPGRARRWAAWCLEAAAARQDTVDAVVLAVSELVTNVYRHSDSPRLLVSLDVTGDGVRLVVHQDAPATDWQQPTGDLAESGRGLILVRALAEQLEVDTDAFGTTVTALIPYAGTGA
jgi:anti-sigma regulatory factor (Ser/Thr protein kinase)